MRKDKSIREFVKELQEIGFDKGNYQELLKKR